MTENTEHDVIDTIDDEERTNSMGLFNTADAFRLAAKALASADIRHGHADQPRYFLYYHALELYLKALLRQEHKVAAIKSFGHNTRRLVSEAEKLGLSCVQEDRGIFDMMADTDMVIEARYIRTGFKQVPPLDALDRTCDRIHASVGYALRKRGEPVRL